MLELAKKKKLRREEEERARATHEVVVVGVLPEVEERAHVWVARLNRRAVLAAVPQVELRRRVAPDVRPGQALARAACAAAAPRQVVEPGPRLVRHAPQVVEDVHLDRDRPEDLVLLPAVGEDALLDDVLDDELGLRARSLKVSTALRREGRGKRERRRRTPMGLPSGPFSRARRTLPYAPLPASPSSHANASMSRKPVTAEYVRGSTGPDVWDQSSETAPLSCCGGEGLAPAAAGSTALGAASTTPGVGGRLASAGALDAKGSPSNGVAATDGGVMKPSTPRPVGARESSPRARSTCGGSGMWGMPCLVALAGSPSCPGA